MHGNYYRSNEHKMICFSDKQVNINWKISYNVPTIAINVSHLHISAHNKTKCYIMLFQNKMIAMDFSEPYVD